MKYFDDVKQEHNPSSSLPPTPKKEKFILPTDPEAEETIDIKGLTTDELIDVAFQGIDLMTYDGTPFTRTSLAIAINSAIATAEQTFDIVLKPTLIENELHDYEGDGFYSHQYTPTFRRPVKEVISMEYLFGNKTLFHIPKNWIKLDSKMGDITIFPTSGSLQIINPAIGVAQPYFMSGRYMPMSVKIDYIAGMDKEDIPMNLMMYILKSAAIDIFQQWGDQIIGAGIASSSLSIDGLSQSIGTTQSAMYGGASARILEYRNDLKEVRPIIRRYFGKMHSVLL